MAMMRFTRLLNKSGLRMVSVVKKAIIGLLVVVIVFLLAVFTSRSAARRCTAGIPTANEMTASEIDHATFAEYQTREAAIFRDMKSKITDTLSDDEKTAINRFYAQSLVYPDKFHPDWNRSFILLPQGKPRGAAVLLHGLTDSPYSVHYLAQRYQQQGFVAVAPRLPGHGTAPARSPGWIAKSG